MTKGGATRQRFKYGYSIGEMGEVRFHEMQNVAKVLNLNGMTVLDLPDNRLKEMDPRDIEKVIIREMETIQPQIVVTYAVHGISGFHDHIVTHAVVKRVYLELKEKVSYLKRLAFVTITEDEAEKSNYFHLSGSKYEEIDCIFEVNEIDIKNSHKALDCYVTFKETIEKTGIKEFIHNQVVFEIFQENFDPPFDDLFDELKKR